LLIQIRNPLGAPINQFCHHQQQEQTKNGTTQRESARLQPAQPQRCRPAENDLGLGVLRPRGGSEEIAVQTSRTFEQVRLSQAAQSRPGRERAINLQIFF